MTPTQLALAAAAALLVCARADNHKNSFSVKLHMAADKHETAHNDDTDDGQTTLSKQYFYNSLVDNQKQFFTENRATKNLNNDEAHNFLLRDRQDKDYNDEKERVGQKTHVNDREDKAYSSGKRTELPSGCLYEGRWYNDGASVSTREDCLHCVCAHGALSCRRRACKPLPDPLPLRCHLRHRRGSCCPELQCPDGVKLMEIRPTSTLDKPEDDHEPEVPTVTPATAANACVEGGSVFAAGSALSSRVPCEQCFCLRGARHCVRPSCLPPPQHCAPRPATGACCPQRYYCDSSTEKPNQSPNRFDCQVDGTLVPEGSPVATHGNCSSCFCLRGEVRCQAMGCAPHLAGCRPLLAADDCCAHQYVCDHEEEELLSHVILGPVNSPASIRSDERTFHLPKASKLETTTNKITSLFTLKHVSFASATKNHLITTAKVKRKTDEQSLDSVQKSEQSTNVTSSNITSTQKPSNAAKYIPNTQSPTPVTTTAPEHTTDQPEAIVKIMVNGTINCTAELSSTSLPLSLIHNDTDNIQKEAMPRVPIVNVEAQTYSPNDIITDRNVNGGFDEDDTFTINVTSSLMTNTSHSTSRPAMTAAKISISGLADALNISNNKKGDFDYDYTEPTLPPSLPNLKIIPFVAADAVVEDDPVKDSVRYPILERPDKFPVYYPATEPKDEIFPIRREDTYQPTQYPIFVMGKVEPPYTPISEEVDLTRETYPDRNDVGVQEYTVSASLGSPVSGAQEVTNVPTTSTTFAVETPAVNRFSPPVETQGGFIPKGSGVIDDFFGVFTSSEPTPTVPHLTTSMQLDVKRIRGECIATDGRHISGGESVVMGCQLCTCSWVELVCERRPCPPPAADCRRLPISNHSVDPCCGDIICGDFHEEGNTSNKIVSNETKIKLNDAKEAVQSQSLAQSSDHNNTRTAATNAKNNKNATVNESNDSGSGSTTTIASTTSTTTSKPANMSTTAAPGPVKQDSDYSHEDEDDDDDEFSFGSVLKLLLSDSYETTTAPNRKISRTTVRPSTAPPVQPAKVPPSNPLPEPPVADTSYFKPLPSNLYPLPKIPPNTVNRIDHLVLGEATAITRKPIRPITNKTTKRPPPETYDTTERIPAMLDVPASFVAPAGSIPNLGGLLGSGILKLAGCNIYGRMYRVGRIITELSTPCQECWCTELGVQCKPLAC